MPRKQVRLMLTMAIIAASIIVVVLLALILGGVLVLPGKAPAAVTITSVHLVVQEGNSSAAGGPWFGPSSASIYYTVGFPLQVPPGGNFSIVWANFINFDSVQHTIRSVHYTTTPSADVALPTTLPSLPYTVAAESEAQNLAIYFLAPSTPGGTYAVTAVVNALNTP